MGNSQIKYKYGQLHMETGPALPAFGKTEAMSLKISFIKLKQKVL